MNLVSKFFEMKSLATLALLAEALPMARVNAVAVGFVNCRGFETYQFTLSVLRSHLPVELQIESG